MAIAILLFRKSNKTMSGYYLAVDPGMKNLGVWAGTFSDDDRIATEKLVKIDLTADKTKPLYEAAVDMVLQNPWMCDPEKVLEAVVETQAPRNMPARIVATAIYGVLRGKGVRTSFSGSALKNKAMAHMSKVTGHRLETKPGRLDGGATEPEKAKRRRLMHRTNKVNAEGVVRKVLEAQGRDVAVAAIEGAGKKVDDLADAVLLGVGLCMSKRKKAFTSSRKQSREKVPEQ